MAPDSSDALDLVTQGQNVLSSGVAFTPDGSFTSAAAFDRPADSGTSVQYVFPVEIEVRASAEALDPDAIASATLARLASTLGNLMGLEGG